MLAKELRDPEMYHPVTRRVYNTYPVIIEYEQNNASSLNDVTSGL